MLNARNRFAFLSAAVFLALMIPYGCSNHRKADESLTLATTTSMQDSGMLDVLLPQFKEQTGTTVKVVAVGSGQAMEIGRRGDADVLITHSPAAEKEFMDEGFGSERRDVMYNDFVLVGPEQDPAEVRGTESTTDAFKKLADRQGSFLSRGDDSGTNKKELAIWDQAGISPEGTWYMRGGVGMAQALRMASEKQIYTLTDRGTFLALQAELKLKILSEGDPLLRNPYCVMVVNPQKHAHVRADAAKQFAEFLTEPKTRQLIAEFGVQKYGQPLFHPAE